MAFTNIGCITATPLFATQQWQAGTKNLGPVALPDKYTGGKILVDISQVTDLLAFLVITVFTTVDGVNYVNVGGVEMNLPDSLFTIGAGGLLDQFGNPVRMFSADLKLLQPGLLTRQIKADVSLSAPALIGATLVIW